MEPIRFSSLLLEVDSKMSNSIPSIRLTYFSIPVGFHQNFYSTLTFASFPGVPLWTRTIPSLSFLFLPTNPFVQTFKQGPFEAVRLALVVGKIPYKEETVSFQDWPALKPHTPMGHLPIMNADGFEVVQTQAMFLNVGKLTGLYPSDAKDALRVDQICETVMEFFHMLFVYKGSDKDELRKVREKAFAVAAPRYLETLNNILWGMSEGPYALGSRLTAADLSIAWIFILFSTGFLEFVPTDALNSYSRMRRIYEAVLNFKEVQEYHRQHPERAPGVCLINSRPH